MIRASYIDRGLARRFSPMARFRIAKGLKQTDVAIRGGLHESTVSKLEIGARAATEDQVRKIARGLRTPLYRAQDLLRTSRQWAGFGASKRAGRS